MPESLGDWCVDAAKTWTESTFVGYDLVDVQVDLQYVEPSVAKRIEWMHGNFLTERLPFDDNEFDFVHIFGIGLSVPEDKEIYRVLKPGGYIEQLEEGTKGLSTKDIFLHVTANLLFQMPFSLSFRDGSPPHSIIKQNA
ncbi:hypothetical protein PHLCEN_2v2811 [Hermanssonia centrifuga]|uniref:Methyltransferase domain-containing protein n=1 Tax=Hermanssonia centrifuga TaxID=98765 RepID=A0A2R6RI17_9APHY|nr:hypothetical protein PHLCEN_2v2811 [Hermanssonia centrifuga]